MLWVYGHYKYFLLLRLIDVRLWRLKSSSALEELIHLFNNNTPHSQQRWTVIFRQLLHTFQWQHATQWATLNCFNQTIVHCANSCKQSIRPSRCIKAWFRISDEWLNFLKMFSWNCLNNSDIFSFICHPLQDYNAKFRCVSVKRAEFHNLSLRSNRITYCSLNNSYFPTAGYTTEYVRPKFLPSRHNLTTCYLQFFFISQSIQGWVGRLWTRN